MPSVFGILVTIFAGYWVFGVVREISREFKRGDQAKWVVGIMGFLMLIGAAGFFGTMLSALDILKLPNSFEWPPGYVRGVVMTADNKHLVPLVPSGRIQMYDSQWHFVRGWHIDAGGGDFKVRSSQDGLIEVLTARGGHRYRYTENGDLISTTTLPESESLYSFTDTGGSMVVPTSPLLWVFSSPLLSWLAVLIGMVGLFVTKKARGGKGQES
jgi:hypothetical protein